VTEALPFLIWARSVGIRRAFPASKPISFQGKGGFSFFSRGDAAEQVNF